MPVALAVVVSERGLLLIRRADRTPPVAFPGGRIEPDETSAGAATREVREETGLHVEALTELGRRVHPATGADLVYVACSTTDDREAQPAPREVTEVGWYGVDETLELMPDLYDPVRTWLAERAAET